MKLYSYLATLVLLVIAEGTGAWLKRILGVDRSGFHAPTGFAFLFAVCQLFYYPAEILNLPMKFVAWVTGIVLIISILFVLYDLEDIAHSLFRRESLIILAIVAVAISLALRSAKNGKLSKSDLVLKNEETVDQGYTAAKEMQYFVGKVGIAKTTLRPAGIVDFDGVKLSVVSDGEYIPKDAKVVVDHVEGVSVVVKLMA